MRNPGSLRRVAAVALLFIFAAVSAGATTYYVRTDGNDFNDGLSNTAGGAWATLGHAVFSVGPNDIVIVDGGGSGIYNQGVTELALGTSGVTIRGTTPNRPTIQDFSLAIGSTDITLENLIFDDRENHETIIPVQVGADNLTIRGCDIMHPANTNTQAQPHGCVIVVQNNGLTIDSCNLLVAPQTGVMAALSYCLGNLELGGPSTNWVITNTVMATIPPTASVAGRGSCIGLHQTTNNVTIDHCTFPTATNHHLFIFDPDSQVLTSSFENWSITNNEFRDTVVLGSAADHIGAHLYIGNAHNIVNWNISNNLFTNSKDDAIHFDQSETRIDGLSITNNLFLNIGEGRISFSGVCVMLDNVFLNPTMGRSTVISNNIMRDTRPAPQGGWGVWVKGNGPGPQIVNNVFDDIFEACILVAGSEVIAEESNEGIRNSRVADNTINGNQYGGIVIRDDWVQTNTSVENNVVTDCRNYGISHEGMALGAVIRFNDVSTCGTNIQIAGPATVCRGNQVFNSLSFTATDGGISITPFGLDDDASDTVVGYNLAVGCAGVGIRVATQWITPTNNINIFNNTLVSNLNDGILVGQDGVNVYNNIIAFHSGAGLRFAATTQGQIGFNLFFNEASAGVNFAGFPGSTSFPGDILEENPMFVDFFNSDFHLAPGSPAIGSGGVLAGATLVPGGIDMGAFPTGAVSASVKPADWTLYR